MSIEKDIFQKRKVKLETLLSYGFKKEKETYSYTKKFMNDAFEAIIIISTTGKVRGKVIDLDTKEEYTNFRVENIVGDFVNTVKEEYEKILKDIAQKCFTKEPFFMPQTNRIANKIKNQYNVDPEFLWKKFPGYAVFRNETSKKWFGIIMNIDKSKLIPDETGEVEFLNVKLDEKTQYYLTQPGIYPAYHMNKKSWVTVILDETLSDEKIMELVKISYELENQKKEWLVPDNPEYYDIMGAFNTKDTLTWKQSSNINRGDIIYIYVGKPYSAILFQCEAIEVNIPYEYKNKTVSMSYIMKLKLLKKYNQTTFSLDKLKEYGVKTIRGPRRVPEKLSKELNKN